MTLNFSSVVILLATLQGLILSGSIATLRRGNRRANRLISLFILLISIALLGRFTFVINTPSLILAKALYLGDIVIFFYGPILYLIFRSLFLPMHTVGVRSLYHYIPLFLYILIIAPFMLMDHESFRKNTTEFLWMFHGLEIAAIVLNWAYFAVILALLRSFLQNSMNTLSTIPQIRIYRLLLSVTGVGLAAWSVSFILRFIGPPQLQSYLGYHLVWMSLSLLIFVFGFYTLRFPEVFHVHQQPSTAELPEISTEELSLLADRIRTVMTEKKPYLNPALTLNDLAGLTAMSVHQLSRVLNQGCNVNFFEFVNSYRVEEYKRLATPEQLRTKTILSVAFDAGFNSKTTFNASFKRITGQTPSEHHRSFRRQKE